MNPKETLETYPDLIATTEASIMNRKLHIEELKEKQRMFEWQVSNEISAEHEKAKENGNKEIADALKNQTLRDAELKNRLAKSVPYQKIISELTQNTRDNDATAIQLSKYKRLFRAAESLVRMGE